MEDTIKISDIRPDNPIVVEAITSQGYAIVKHSYLEQCNRESAELARIKFDLKKRPERGLAIWEEDVSRKNRRKSGSG